MSCNKVIHGQQARVRLETVRHGMLVQGVKPSRGAAISAGSLTIDTISKGTPRVEFEVKTLVSLWLARWASIP